MSTEPQDAAETSKAGALRMRRLARLTPLIPPPAAAVHHPTGQIIYPASTSTFTGHFISSFAPSSQPRPLALQPYLGPGKEISISPGGEWIVMFHPAPSTAYQTSEGGTLAIYPSSILSPLALPQNIQPVTIFALPNDVLAIQHIYGEPPSDTEEGTAAGRGAGTGASTGIGKTTYGPHPPSTYHSSQGPAFLVLTSTGVILFHPQAVPPAPGQPMMGTNGMGEIEQPYAYATLKCPLHTRWYASSGGMPPPDIGRVDRGWAGIVRGDEGVWFAYEDTEVHGILRAEVIIKDGKASLLTTRMPPLPVPNTLRRRCQGALFTSIPAHALPPGLRNQRKGAPQADNNDDGGDVSMVDEMDEGNGGDRVGERDGALVGVVVIGRTTTPATESTPVQVQTHIATYAIQRCEVDIVDAFREINGTSGEKMDAPAAWDWALSDQSLPSNTLILALTPLQPVLHPRAVALLATPPNATPVLTHIDLCPDTTASPPHTLLDPREEGIPIDPELILGISAPCMLSLAAEHGRGGQVGVLDPRKGPVFYALDTGGSGSASVTVEKGVEGAGDVGGDKRRNAEERIVLVACEAIVDAVRKGRSYADVLGAVLANTPSDRVPSLTTRIVTDCFASFQRDVQVDADESLLRLQIALFGHTGDPRLSLAVTLLRLREASQLFDQCAISTSQGIVFELDAIWPLIPVAEDVISSISSILRQFVLYKGNTAWSPSSPSSSTSSPAALPCSFILLLHPTCRALLLRLLAQLRTFRTFVSTLELPILQPESRFAPAPAMRDPRATIVAKERVVDLGWRDGVDIMLWGKGLSGAAAAASAPAEAVGQDGSTGGENVVGGMDEAGGKHGQDEERALIQLDPGLLGDKAREILDRLPCPSEILLSASTDLGSADTAENIPIDAVDGITFLPLDPAPLPAAASNTVAPDGTVSISGAQEVRLVRCDTCGTRTEALGWTDRPSKEMGYNGKRYAAGIGGSAGWNSWRGKRERGCICGGAWTR